MCKETVLVIFSGIRKELYLPVCSSLRPSEWTTDDNSIILRRAIAWVKRCLW